MSTVMLNKRAMKRLAKDFSALTKEPLVNANARPTDDMSMWNGTISKKIFLMPARNLFFLFSFCSIPCFCIPCFPCSFFLNIQCVFYHIHQNVPYMYHSALRFNVPRLTVFLFSSFFCSFFRSFQYHIFQYHISYIISSVSFITSNKRHRTSTSPL